MNLTGLTYAGISFITAVGIAGEWAGAPWQGLWRILAVALIVGLALEGHMTRRIKLIATRHMSDVGYLGEQLQATLFLSNPHAYPLVLETQQRFPSGLTGSEEITRQIIPAYQTNTWSFSMTPHSLGRVEWGPVYSRLQGPWRLAWWPKTLLVPGSIRIVPARLQQHESHLGLQDHGQFIQRHQGQGKDFLWHRDYLPGDSLRAIDWKATARSGRRIVRVWTEEQNVELMILIDAGRKSGLLAGALTRLNHAINVAARLGEKALLNGDQVGLIVFADRPHTVVSPARGQLGLRQLRRILEGLSPSERESNPLAAIQVAKKLLHRRSLVLILTDIDEADMSGQLVHATTLLTQKHLPMIAGILDPGIIELRDQKAKNWLDPYYSYAASASLKASQGHALALQRLGACTVLAQPDQLDGAVLHSYQNLRTLRRI